MAEIPRHTADFPRGGDWLVSAQQHALALLAEIDVGLVINTRWQAGRVINHDLNLIGDQIVMFHRLHRNMRALHMAQFTRPKTRTVDDNFGIYRAFGRGHIPAAIRALGGGCDGRVGEILRAMHLGGLGKCIGRARGVHIAILTIPQHRVIMFRINQRMFLCHFLG